LWLSDSKYINGEVTFKQTTTTLLQSFSVAHRVYNSINSPLHVSKWYKKVSQ